MQALEVRLAAGLTSLARKPRAAALALVLMMLALVAPGLAGFPVTDRDEARFAQSSKQMLESGDYIDIRLQEAPRYKKPVGIYWMQAAATALFGEGARTAIWTYRLPSLLSALLAALALWWAARPLWGPQVALGAAALFGAGFTLAFEGRIAKADAAQTVAIVVMFGALARAYLWRRPRSATVGSAMTFWLALAAAILIKGPVAPIILALTLATLLIADHDWRWLGNLHAAWGVPVLLTVIVPWFLAITLRTGPEFWRLSMGQDFAAKIAGGQENHGGPPGSYIVAFWLTFWPATLLAAGAAFVWLWQARRFSRRALLLIAWVVPFWLVLELTPTKLPHYALPLYPALAVGLVWALRERLAGGTPLPATYRHAALLWFLVAAGFLAAFGVALWLFERTPQPVEIALLGFAAVGIAATVIAAWRGAMHLACVGAIVVAAMIYAAGFREIAPRLDALWPGRGAAQARAALGDCIQGPATFSGFNEPSAVFLNGTATLLQNSAAAVGVAVREGRAGIGFSPAEEAAQALGAERVGCVPAVDLNGKARGALGVFVRSDAAACARGALAGRFACSAATPRWQGRF